MEGQCWGWNRLIKAYLEVYNGDGDDDLYYINIYF
jgi:hypothetical protein